ncbi:MAG TPA: 7,8-didemethyl-8-hydroxy-5-deazariboflavin synthase subunit CofH [Actinobacteria bacterium]|nr:7,8-didemethyl-8-hydroxy-5-deazariboflavin synthase subunit CofH [Actinomycetota bacterium]
MSVTFCRLRPAERVVDLWAATRRREGATAVELAAPTRADVDAALAAGLLPVARSVDGEVEPAAWVVTPAAAKTLADRGVPGWRITIVAEDLDEALLDVVARSGARWLRVRRGRLAEAAKWLDLPGLGTVASVFVDSVAQALAAVDAGARDLLLRGWNTESIGELRDALDVELVERTVFGLDVGLETARTELPDDVLRVWLGQIDAQGACRPRTGWAPGKQVPPPAPAGRLSARWSDPRWHAAPPAGLPDASPELRPILERSLDGAPPTRDEVERLFRATGGDVEAIAAVADELRRRRCGDVVTYVVNRNINYTNLCTYRCGFCAFSKGPRSLQLRGEPYLLPLDEVVARAVEAHRRGATEVCLQGGIHPEFTGAFYLEVVEAIKDAVPDLHVHGFTPLEVWQGAATLGLDVAEFLRRLADAGLGTLPGTAAEILDDRIRRHLCPDKLTTAEWAHVMVTAHELGLRATCTMMFGHVDDPAAWANHLEVLRRIQRRTGGFTEFVPLPFVHMGAPIYLRGRARPGPTWDEVVLVHAVARIAFDGLVDHVQASWVKLGLDGARRLLEAGCDDLGGTLMDESISRAAGASHGTEVTPADLEALARSVGRTPRRRTTLYGPVETIVAEPPAGT